MSKPTNVVSLDTAQPLPEIPASGSDKPVHALTARLQGAGAEIRAYAASHLALRPAASALVLGSVALIGSLLVYHYPVVVGDIVAGKIVAMVLLLAALFQLVVATIRSLSVPIIGFVLGFAAENATIAGLISPYVDPAFFRYVLIACAIGVIGRCVFLRE